MSWFKRKQSFVEDEEIAADDFEAEFDAIGEALNGLVRMGVASASGNLVTNETGYQDVPGATATLAPSVNSLVHVTAVFEVESEGSTLVTGACCLDGTVQSQLVHIGPTSNLRVNVSQVYVLTLPAGSHIIKLQAKRAGKPASILAGHTRISYVMSPGP